MNSFNMECIIMYRSVIKPTSLAISMAFILSACGGEDGDASSEVKPTPSSAITALNGLATAKVNTPTSLDLTPYVIGNGSLVNMFSDNPRCESSVGNGFGVNVFVGRAGRCDYTYTVSNEEGLQSSAQMVVVTSSIPNPVLTPVSVAVILGQTNVAINLNTLLGAAIPDGFSLTTDFVIQSASGSTNGEVNKTGALELMYTAPDALGWNYIAYTLTNASNETLIGHIFVSISDKINEPPVITPKEGFTYPHSVVINTPVTLDLENTEGLDIEDDSGSWQLSDVKAIGATVNANDVNDVNNKKFTFTASTIGRYDVAYIASDHAGGSTLGVVRFNVDSVPTIPSNWTDITVGKAFYTGPLTHDKAMDAGSIDGSSEKEQINGSYFDVARWSVTSAQLYCDSKGGKLPNKGELNTLRRSGSSELKKWPKAIPYFTYNYETNVTGLYGLSDGSSSTFIPGYQAYLTCIEKGLANLTLTPAYDNDGVNTTADSVIAGKPLVVKAKLTLRRDPTVGVSGITITPSLDEAMNVQKGVETIVCPDTTDDRGMTSCRYTNTTAGDFGVIATEEQGSEGDARATAMVKVIPDMEQLEWTAPDSVVVVVGSVTSIPVKKADIYGNVVPGIQADIIDSNPSSANWTLGIKSAVRTPSISAPTEGDIVLNITSGTYNAKAKLQLDGSPHKITPKSVALSSSALIGTCPVDADGISTNMGECIQAVPLYGSDTGPMVTGQITQLAHNMMLASGVEVPDTDKIFYENDLDGTKVVILKEDLNPETVGIYCSSYNKLKIGGRSNWTATPGREDYHPINGVITDEAKRSLLTRDGKIRGVYWNSDAGRWVTAGEYYGKRQLATSVPYRYTSDLFEDWNVIEATKDSYEFYATWTDNTESILQRYGQTIHCYSIRR